MNKEEVLQHITHTFGEEVYNFNTSHGVIGFETNRAIISEVLKFLKNHSEIKCNFLTDICGVHYPGQKLPLGVVYHLHSFSTNIRLRIKVFLSDNDPVIPSAVSLWKSAGWMERETFDFFGIIFDGHPNLKRILNMDSLGVHPMRKEYPLEDPNRVDKNDAFFGR